jgi:AcrR family transcriptional regulator
MKSIYQEEQSAPVGTSVRSSAQNYGFYPKGEETRQRLLDVAIAVFAEKGFAGASTREIAQLANTNIVSIHYYFGNKQTLYYEAMEASVQKLTSLFSQACKRAETCLSRSIQSRHQLLEGLLNLLDDSVAIMFGLNGSLGRLCWMHDDGLNGTFNEAQERLHSVSYYVSRFLARLTNRTPDSSEVRTQCLALMAVITFPWSHQTFLLRSLGWECLDEESAQQIRDALRSLIGTIVPTVK